jgi:hypothetical protein
VGEAAGTYREGGAAGKGLSQTSHPLSELLLAHGSQPLRGLIAQLDGCTGGQAGEFIAAAGLDRMSCNNISRPQAAGRRARGSVRPVIRYRSCCLRTAHNLCAA